jgi:deoxyribodipyrimidine photolyase
MPVALLWLRRDLRLDDNPALQALLDDGHTPVAVYIHDEIENRVSQKHLWLQAGVCN